MAYRFLVHLLFLWNINTLNAVRTTFSFNDIYSFHFHVKTFTPEWRPGSEAFLYQNSTDDVIMYNATNDARSVVIPASVFVQLQSNWYSVSPDMKYALFAIDVKQQWRHSFEAKYVIMNLETRKRYKFPNNELGDARINIAQWSSMGQSLTFVYKNNLYMQQTPTSLPRQITSDGNQTVFNGVPDWLYEEEILEDRTSHSWSPDNRFIFFARIDDSCVHRQYWPYYGDQSDVYGNIRSVTYPKAGYSIDGKPGPTSLVQLFVVDVDNNLKITKLPPPADLVDKDHYYLRASWRDRVHLLVTWSNRVQNESFSVLYNADHPQENTKNLNMSQSNGWIAVPHPKPWFYDNGERYLTILPYKTASDSSRQVAVVTCKPEREAGEVLYLTRGPEVQEIVGLNEIAGYLYYISSYHSRGRQLMKVKIPRGRMSFTRAPPVCMSCSDEAGINYVCASFSASGEYYILAVQGPQVPKFILKSASEDRGAKSVVLENNRDLELRLRQKLVPTKHYFNFKNGDGSNGYGQVLVPPLPAENETFPMLVFTYAGPGTQAVTSSFILGRTINNWLVHMASEHRVLVVSTDGRGSMGNGDDLKFAIYKNLSRVEIEDQILGAETFKEKSRFKIADNAAIFGWSYGGFAAAHSVANNKKTFMCGVSVAPTTNKGIYDTAYSERYMGLITDPNGVDIYDRTNLVNKVDFLKKKKYFIAHGIADDNVHYTHFAHFVRALQIHGVMFRQNSYPDENHAIATTPINRHLFKSITEFLLNDCWSRDKNVEVLPNQDPVEEFFQTVHNLFADMWKGLKEGIELTNLDSH